MAAERRICPKCKKGPFQIGRAFSSHLSQCESAGVLWDNFLTGDANYERLVEEARNPQTLTQRMHAVTRDMKRPHIEGNTRLHSHLSAVPSLSHLATSLDNPYLLDIEFGTHYDDDMSFSSTEDVVEGVLPSNGVPDSFDKIVYKCDLPPSVLYQVHLEHVIRGHRVVDLSLLDDVTKIVQLHVSRGLDLKSSKLYTREQLVRILSDAFNMRGMKPKIVKVPVSNGCASVAVFDVKNVLLSLLHDTKLMKPENFAPGYDIFTGKATVESTQYGEVHTGWVFEQARAKYCGDDPDVFPLPLVSFYDKTYIDIYGSLSCAPYITFPAIFNLKCRSLLDFCCVFGYIPSLSCGKGKTNKQSSTSNLQQKS